MMTMISNFLALLGAATSFAAAAPPAGTQGRYAMLSCKTSAPPPLVRVNYLYGPTELVRDSEYQWWQLEGFEKDDPKAEPQFQLQALTSRDPLSESMEPLKFARYILRVPASGDTLEYRNIHDKQARLPAWHDFELAPHPSRVGVRRDQFPESCQYLGHLLNLHQVEKNVAWKPFASVKVLDLDPELLVGTARAFKDKEGHRLPPSTQPKDYTYVPFGKDDYAVMIEAGI